jgi:transposase
MELPPPTPPDDHRCPWREEAEALRHVVAEQQQALTEQQQTLTEQQQTVAELTAKLDAVMAAMEALERRVLGPKSEKLPPPESEIRRRDDTDEDAEQRRLRALARRREREALKAKLREQTVTHHLADDQKECPRCGGTVDRVLPGKQTILYEYVPGTFVRQKHVQEKRACACGAHIATADPPRKVVEGGRYGAGFIAHLCVMKCGDSIPLHRLAKQYQRLGIPMSRSTLTDLFHAAAARAAPLSQRLIEIVARSDIVQADETSMMMQRPHRRGFVWAFITDNLIAYRFAPDRSGETPRQVLGGTTGTLVVDAYTGYNRVTDVDGRARASCLAHVRRRFFDALTTAPVEARQALDLILDVYRVEHEAKERDIVRTADHLALRQTRGRAAMDALHAWLVEQQDRHPPKSPLGGAIRYALNRGDTLTRFLDDARIPVDNNASERALRVVALGRKNFMFVGDPDKGDNLAGLYSLVSTCETHDVDPVAYLADVLLRVDTHPASRIDELLPQHWQPPIRVEVP